MSDLRKFFAKEMDEEIQKVRDEYEKRIADLESEIVRLRGNGNFQGIRADEIGTIGVTGSVGPAGQPGRISTVITPSQITHAKYNWTQNQKRSWQSIDEAADFSQQELQKVWEKVFGKKKEDSNEHP